MDDVLAKLRDIHLPSPIVTGKIDPTLYLLFGGVVAIFVIGVVLWCRKIYKTKRQALLLLKNIELKLSNSADLSGCSAEISNILRKVALIYYPRSKVAGLYGMDWLLFLNTTSSKLDFFALQYELLELPYTKDYSHNINLTPLIKLARAWILQRRKV